jgi:hypothetical protein
MNKLSIIIIIILGIALIAAGVFCFTLMQSKSALTAELTSTQSELASKKAELDTTACTLSLTEQELSVTKADLVTTKNTLTSTRLELNTTKDALASTRSELDTANQTLSSKLVELNSANSKITSVQKSLDTLQASISSTQQQLTAAQETLKGLGITISASSTCYDVALADNTAAKNPTWKELMAFIAKDKTENHAYILDTYDCSQYSRDVHNNAEAAGIRAAEVQVTFQGDTYGHALNAFLTTDYGLVYIDCTEFPDKIARVKSGKDYRAIDLNWSNATNARNDSWFDSQPLFYFFKASSGGYAIVSKIRIYW